MTPASDRETGEAGPSVRDDVSEGAPESAPRRTRLAAERTFLAWLRTGLTEITVALAIGRVVPALIGGPRLAYTILGAGYGVMGAFMIAYALLRVRRVESVLDRNGPVPQDPVVLVAFTVAGLALAVATVALVLFAA